MLAGFRTFQRGLRHQDLFRNLVQNNSTRVVPSFIFFKQSEIVNPISEDKAEIYHVYASHPDPLVAQQWLGLYQKGAVVKNLQAKLVIVPEDSPATERPYVVITFVYPKTVNTILNHIGLKCIEDLEADENNSKHKLK